MLRSYQWPGNIRQLLNALEFAKAFCSDGTIDVADLPDYVSQKIGSTPPDQQRGSRTSSEGDDDTAELERLLGEHGWNVSEVARALNVARTTIHRRMNKAGLVPPNRR